MQDQPGVEDHASEFLRDYICVSNQTVFFPCHFLKYLSRYFLSVRSSVRHSVSVSFRLFCLPFSHNIQVMCTYIYIYDVNSGG